MIRRLTLLWRRFTPLEERLLAEIRHLLPADAQMIFDAQVAGITRVQRLPSWSEVDFYRMKKGKPDWRGVPMFPRTDEFRLAEIRFQAGGTSYKATLSCVNGHIFDVAVTPGPGSAAFLPWDGEPRAVLLEDPLRAPAGSKPREMLPSEWRDVLSRLRTRKTGAWALHDETTAHRVALPDGEYLVLAEREGDEFILQRIEPKTEGLFHLASHDGVPQPIFGEIQNLITRPT